MQLIKWEPLSDLDSWFGDFSGVSFPKYHTELAMDISEKDGVIEAKLQIPGIDFEKIDVRLDGRMLHISGSREEEKEERGRSYWRKEIRSGTFARGFRLPKDVNAEKAEATYAKGVLLVRFPIATKQEGGGTKIKVSAPTP